MQGKYTSASRFYAVRAQRAALRTLIRPLVSWEEMASPEDGYSIILGCTHRLSDMLSTNLLMLSRQDLTHLREVIVVIDANRDAMLDDFERDLRSRYSALPLRFLYYSQRQLMVTGVVRWAWVYSWLSWCIGISAVKTRYALLHDFDAMLIDRDMLRKRYERMQREPIDYLGVRYYHGNGVHESDRLVTTFEMMFDCAFVRHHFRPLDLFNHVSRHRSRTVDFDTFLYAQSCLGRAAVMPLAEEDMVHPSQMICQFTELMSGRELNPARSSLLLIPYFLSVTDASQRSMIRIMEQLSRNGSTAIDFFGKPMRLNCLQLSHAQWLAELASRMEQSVFGSVRADVRSYFDAICKHAHSGDHVLANGR